MKFEKAAIALVCGIISVLFSSVPSHAAITTAVLTDDAQTDSDDPSTAQSHTGNLNFGQGASRDQDVYFMFDVSGIGANTSINTATLTVRTRNDVNTTVTIEIFALTDDSWDESTLTHNIGAALTTGPSQGTASLEPFGAGTSQLDALDVTSFVQNQVNLSDLVVGFKLTTTGGISPGGFLRSKEHGTQTEHPWLSLVIDSEPIPEPSAVSALALAGAALLSRRRTSRR